MQNYSTRKWSICTGIVCDNICTATMYFTVHIFGFFIFFVWTKCIQQPYILLSTFLFFIFFVWTKCFHCDVHYLICFKNFLSIFLFQKKIFFTHTKSNAIQIANGRWNRGAPKKACNLTIVLSQGITCRLPPKWKKAHFFNEFHMFSYTLHSTLISTNFKNHFTNFNGLKPIFVMRTWKYC